MKLSTDERTKLRQFLVDRFSLDDLKDLAFDLALSWEDIPHSSRKEFARNLIELCERLLQLGCLLNQALQRRFDSEVALLVAKIAPCNPRQLVQIIFHQADAKRSIEDIRSRLAEIFDVQPDEISLIGAKTGSIHLLVGIPSNEWMRFVEKTGKSDAIIGSDIISVNAIAELPNSVSQKWLINVRDSTYSPLKFFDATRGQSPYKIITLGGSSERQIEKKLGQRRDRLLILGGLCLGISISSFIANLSLGRFNLNLIIECGVLGVVSLMGLIWGMSFWEEYPEMHPNNGLEAIWHRLIRRTWLVGLLFLDGRVSIWAKILPVVAVAYVIFSPDLVPDIVEVIGLVDDLLILVISFWLFWRFCALAVKEENMRVLKLRIEKS